MPDKIPHQIAWLNGTLVRAYHDLRTIGLTSDALVVARWLLELADRYPQCYPAGWTHQSVINMLARGELPTYIDAE